MNLKEINEIEALVQQYFDENEIEKALSTYRVLIDEFPKSPIYYFNYISFLQEEMVLVELLQEAYTEALLYCSKALDILADEDKEEIYAKKLEVYIALIDGSFNQWYFENENEVNDTIKLCLAKYSSSSVILRRVLAIYRMLGLSTEQQKILNDLYAIDSNDFMVVQSLALSYENMDQAISIVEKWIQSNRDSESIVFGYQLALNLYKKSGNSLMIAKYQELLKNKY